MYGTIKPSFQVAINEVNKHEVNKHSSHLQIFFAKVCLRSNLQSSFNILLSEKLPLCRVDIRLTHSTYACTVTTFSNLTHTYVKLVHILSTKCSLWLIK